MRSLKVTIASPEVVITTSLVKQVEQDMQKALAKIASNYGLSFGKGDLSCERYKNAYTDCIQISANIQKPKKG